MGAAETSMVAIVGVGLIGGSLAAALRRTVPQCRVVGVGRSAVRLKAAQQAGLLDEFSTDVDAVLSRAGLVILCTPVDEAVATVRHVCGVVSAEAVVTDAGSVKRSICEAAAEQPCFVGSHPIAGKERSGWEHADPELFQGRLCVITPGAHSSSFAVERVTELWQRVGMTVTSMPAEEHDAALGMTSHLPHVVAAAVAKSLRPAWATLVGTGFRSTTRVAAGPAELWTPILLENRDAVLQALGHVSQELELLRTALEQQDRTAIVQWLSAAAEARRSLDEESGTPRPTSTGTATSAGPERFLPTDGCAP
jgi:cyclohexadieny/prephenate dehydrogenase